MSEEMTKVEVQVEAEVQADGKTPGPVSAIAKAVTCPVDPAEAMQCDSCQ